MNYKKIDWLKVILHFICGAFLGALIGFGFWVYWFDEQSIRASLFWLSGGALVIGLLAAIFLDRFWEGLKRYSYWFTP
jgi:hypothetical protein